MQETSPTCTLHVDSFFFLFEIIKVLVFCDMYLYLSVQLDGFLISLVVISVELCSLSTKIQLPNATGHENCKCSLNQSLSF